MLASNSDSTIITAARELEHAQDGDPLGRHHLVDVVALRRQHQRAVDHAKTLHGNRDRDDHLAAVVDAHTAAALTPRSYCSTS
ncbi:MAG: hypothetical protein R3D69_09710 [Xanthobacteraceae bacterium]